MKKSWLFRSLGVVGLVAMAILLMISPVLANTTTTTTAPPSPPTVATNAATYTQMSSTGNPEITLNGTLTIGSYKSVSVYFEYGLTTSYGYTSAKITKTTSGTFSATAITNPAAGTTYDYRADVKYGSTVVHGSNQTAAVSGGSGGGSGDSSTVIYAGITVAPSATMTINNNVLCIGDINVGDGGILTINGDVHCVGNISNGTTQPSTITINGDCYCSGAVENSVGVINIYGNLFTCSLTQDDSTSDGDLNIYGNATVYNTLTAGNADGFLVQGNLTCVNLTFLPNGYFEVGKDVSVDALNVNQDGIHLTINGGLTVTTSAFSLGQGVSGSMTVGGRLYCSGGYAVNAGATLTTGAQEVTGNISVGTGATLTVNGDCYTSADFTATHDHVQITINGNLFVGTVMEGLNFGGTDSWMTVVGDILTGMQAGLDIHGGEFNCHSLSCMMLTIEADVNCYVWGNVFVSQGTTVGTSGTLMVDGTADFYGGYTLSSGATLTVENMPTLTPVTTTGD